MIKHVPEDMTVTVAAEVTLAALQAELAKRGQWLPIDPPAAETLTVRALLDTNASGPRRHGFGTIREHLLGIQVKLPDGRVIKSGGKVVKNVAGYDLGKLFVGAQGTLGTILEATFKLRPMPEAEQCVQARCASLDQAGALVEAIVASELAPVVFDLVSPATVVLGFAGSREEVDWQLAKARDRGLTEPATLAYDREFPQALSVLPSKLIETIQQLGLANPPLHPSGGGESGFVARAGNGVVHFRSPGVSPVLPTVTGGTPVLRLQQRLLEAFGG